MKYIIIGLGKYGRTLAETLSTIGNEVIGVDTNEERVEKLKDKLSTTFILDATDPQSLSVLPLLKVDVVIVAFTKDFGKSIRIIAMLKKAGVKHIYARMIDSIHRTVIESFEIDKVLTPEHDSAYSTAIAISLGINIEMMKVDDDNSIIKFQIPQKCAGYLLSDFEQESGIKIISLTRNVTVKNMLGMNVKKQIVAENIREEGYSLEENDIITCFANNKKFSELWKSINKS